MSCVLSATGVKDEAGRGPARFFFTCVAEGPLTLDCFRASFGREREPQRPGWFKLFQHLKEKVTPPLYTTFI